MNWSVLTTLQNAAEATGNGDPLHTNNYGGASIQISGTFTGTITFEGTTDGVNWVAIPALLRTTGVLATTATAAGIYYLAVPGIVQVRARVSAYTDGEITAKGIAVPLYSTPIMDVSA